MARLTTEDIEISNRFELVALSTQRTKDILSGAPITIERGKHKAPVISLREFANGCIDLETLREQFITSLQKNAKVDNIEGENLYAETQEDIQDDNDSSYTEATDLFVGNSHSDFDEDQPFDDDIITEDKQKL
ncbi:MAG: DNA-directed RNA polymerase subunit omega [Rickettsiaceae bacterium]|nr:DNA-directed RNA polymerase subunit omega [Rickettsiaceae bacterium]